MTAKTPWYEDDAFWEAWAPIGFHEERLADADHEVERMQRLLEPPPGAAVLDLCCGIGRHALALARRGFCVTGVDRNDAFLRRARERTDREGPSIAFVKADMRDFRRPGAFDTAINLWTSFGYFDDESDNTRVLDNLFASLRPGGRLLMEMMGKEALARIFQPRRWEEGDGVILCSDNKVVENWRYIQSRWTFLRGPDRRDFDVRLRCYSAVELTDMLEGAGFTDIRVYGDTAGSPYDHNAQRLVVTTRRPGP